MANDRQDAVVFFVPIAHTHAPVNLFLHRTKFLRMRGTFCHTACMLTILVQRMAWNYLRIAAVASPAKINAPPPARWAQAWARGERSNPPALDAAQA